MRRLLTASMKKNKIYNRMKKQADLNYVLKFTDKEVQNDVKQLYESDTEMAKIFDVLADSGYKFDKNFKKDISEKFLGYSTDLDTLLKNYQDNENLDKPLKDFITECINKRFEEEDFSETLKKEDLIEIVKYFVDYKKDFLKNEEVKETFLSWFDDNMTNANFEYVFKILLNDNGFKNTLLNNEDNRNAVLEVMPDDFLKKYIDNMGGEVIPVNDIINDLNDKFKVYQSPDGIVIFNK